MSVHTTPMFGIRVAALACGALLAYVPIYAHAQVSSSAQTTSFSQVSFTRLLTIASIGADVTALQSILHTQSLLSVLPTGYFGVLTKAAVMQFQTAHNLEAVGYTGPLTRALLNGLLATPASAPVGNTSSTQPGSTGGSTSIGSSTPDPVTLSFHADDTSIKYGKDTELTWSAKNATDCVASNGWSGSKVPSGSQTVSPTKGTTYRLTCSNAVSEVTKSVHVGIISSGGGSLVFDTTPPTPTASITASSTSIREGNSTGLGWSSTNATSCTGTNFSTASAISGFTSVSPVSTTTYSVSCTGTGGTASASTTVNVIASTTPLINTIVIEGDSITSTNPQQAGNHGDFYSYYWADQNTGKTSYVVAQGSRTVGGAAYNGNLEDVGTPTGNTLLAHTSDDLAFSPQLLTVMVGANDLGTFQTATYKQRLIDWAGPIRSAGVKIAYSPPTPYRQTNPQPTYTTFNNNRTSLLSDVRNPAVWGQWADYYFPMGQHPDFLDSANDAALYGDGVHPSGPVTVSTTGQARLYAIYDAFMTSVLDATRTNSTQMYNSAWPGNQTTLSPSTTYTTRFIVKGLAHAGIALAGGNALSISGGSGQLRVNGGSYATSSSGWLYNGDVIDIQVTTSSSASTTVTANLTVGSETRALTYTTAAAVTPADYVHGDVEGQTPVDTVHTYASRVFTSSGLAVVAVSSSVAPSSVTVGSNSTSTPVFNVQGDYASLRLSVFLVPVTAGTKDIVLTFPSSQARSVISWGTLTNVDATPTQIDSSNTDGDDSDPQVTNSLTVPSSGLTVGFIGVDAGATPPTITQSSGTLVDSGSSPVYQSETYTLGISRRSTTGIFGWNASFGPHPRGAIVFKAAGS